MMLADVLTKSLAVAANAGSSQEHRVGVAPTLWEECWKEGVLYTLHRCISRDRGRFQTKSGRDAKRRLRSLLKSCSVSADECKSEMTIHSLQKHTMRAHVSLTHMRMQSQQ